MTNRRRIAVGGVLLALIVLVEINDLTGAQTYDVWTAPSGEWKADVLYKRSRLVYGPTSVSVLIVCVAKNLIVRAKFLGVVDRPAAIDSTPGFVTIDAERFTIGPGSLYGSEVEAFVFEAPNCGNAARLGGR